MRIRLNTESETLGDGGQLQFSKDLWKIGSFLLKPCFPTTFQFLVLERDVVVILVNVLLQEKGDTNIFLSTHYELGIALLI